MLLAKASPVAALVQQHTLRSSTSRSATVAFARFQQRYPTHLQATRDTSSNSATTSTTTTKAFNTIQVPTWVPDQEDDTGYSRPVIQWYPGHIAKAERALKETFQAVDVVVEVRDARASKATSHPRVPEWCTGRPRLVVFTHVDLVPAPTHRAWKKYHEINAAASTAAAAAADAAAAEAAGIRNSEDESANTDTASSIITEHNPNDRKSTVQYLWVNAKQGQGIPALHRAIFKAGGYVQERRNRRGLKDRPLRVGLMGYPNVGKSALINRLLGRRRAKTANIPGVTRSLQWIRVRTDDNKKTSKKEYELLDSPGIIPASLEDQSDALLLAACHCIGEASYDNQVVASYLCQWMQNLMITGKDKDSAPDWRKQSKIRWGVDPLKPVPIENPTGFGGKDGDENSARSRYVTGEEILYMVADNKCKSSPEDAARKILQDFRGGRMGAICLQLAPPILDSDENDEQDFSQVPDPRMGTMRTEGMGAYNDWELRKEQEEKQARERSVNARTLAKERGLELPPQLLKSAAEKAAEAATAPSIGAKDSKKLASSTEDVGKGLFDGW